MYSSLIILIASAAVLSVGCAEVSPSFPVLSAPLFHPSQKSEEPAAQELKQKLERRGLGLVRFPGSSDCQTYPARYRNVLEKFPGDVILFNAHGLIGSVRNFRNDPVKLRILRLENDKTVQAVQTHVFSEARYIMPTVHITDAFFGLALKTCYT